MREILFRGKRVENGEWVYGYYCGGNERGTLNPAIFSYLSDKQSYDCQDINIETLGQYTGLTDKNGKKIFEGDIVNYPIEKGKYSETNIHEVVFETRGGSGYFGIKMSDVETWGFCFEVPSKLMTIIGNIHDNPELMEAKQ